MNTAQKEWDGKFVQYAATEEERWREFDRMERSLETNCGYCGAKLVDADMESTCAKCREIHTTHTDVF